MMRAVIDVNLLVRSILSPRGGSARLLELLKRRAFLNIAGRRQLVELYRVLGYQRLTRRYHISRRQRRRLIAQLYLRSVWVEIPGRLAICRDPNDDYLIEMAFVGLATHIVTEDNDFHTDPELVAYLHQRGIHVTKLAAFLSLFSA